jgi:hypothetical protein
MDDRVQRTDNTMLVKMAITLNHMTTKVVLVSRMMMIAIAIANVDTQ